MILLILLHKCPNNSKEHLFSRLRVLLPVSNLHANVPEKPCPTSFMKGNFPDSMFLSRVTSVGVDSYISQVDNNKSIGPYCIPAPLLKILKTPIPPFLSSIINDSLLCGIFPSKLKLTQATAVFKKGSKQEPISLLPILVKLLKKLCLSAFMVILSIKTFLIHFNLVLSKRAQLIMH